jgi:HTH-type transcriptional repressor of NAD biosynthesis genes
MPEFRHGLVIGKFYPLHVGHSHLIRTALRRCSSVTVEVLGASVESVPLATRVDWVRQEHPSARVVSAMDDAVVDYESEEAWAEHMLVIESLLVSPVDAVFSSDGYGEELAERLGARWVQVDPGRLINPVSATAIRADVPANWRELAAPVRATLAPRVVVAGAESTGTTTLSVALALAYATEWVPEYGRGYTELRAGGADAPWRPDEFDIIVDRQIELEDAALRRVPRPLLVCDTDIVATAIWHERYIGVPAPAILRRASQHLPALFILTGDEIPFVQDGSRDGEHVRHAMQRRFREVLASYPTPWIEVHGSIAERIEQARVAIDAMLEHAFDFAPPLDQTEIPPAS